MRFRRLNSVGLSYNRQAMIHYTLLCYRQLPRGQQQAIEGRIRRACGERYEDEYFRPVIEWITGQRSMVWVMQEYGVSDKRLLQIRKALFENW